MNTDRINQLKAFSQTNPQDCFLLHALGLEYKENQPEEAKKYFQKVVEVDPFYVGTYYHLAEVLIELDDLDLAKDVYESGIEHCKKKGDAHALKELSNAYQNFLFEYDMD